MYTCISKSMYVYVCMWNLCLCASLRFLHVIKFQAASTSAVRLADMLFVDTKNRTVTERLWGPLCQGQRTCLPFLEGKQVFCLLTIWNS